MTSLSYAAAAAPQVDRFALFSSKEWADIEIGHAIIQDRIAQRQSHLDFLNGDAPISDKILACLGDIAGNTPANPPRITSSIMSSGPRTGAETLGIVVGEPVTLINMESTSEIERYQEDVRHLLNTYNSANIIAQSLMNTHTLEDKNKYQNDLCYLFLYEKRNFHAKRHQYRASHQHTLEDDFYDMIIAKMCATATKDYAAVLDKYLVVSETGITVNNDQLMSDYFPKYKKCWDTFVKSSPILLLDTNSQNNVSPLIKQIFKDKAAAINTDLEDVKRRFLKIGDEHQTAIERRPDFGSPLQGHAIYNYYGPVFLNTVQTFRDILATIKKIEEESITWLTNFKEDNKTKKLFRQLPAENKKQINDYLQQKDTELRAGQEAKQDAAPLKTPKKKKQPNKKKEPLLEVKALEKQNSALTVDAPLPATLEEIASPLLEKTASVVVAQTQPSLPEPPVHPNVEAQLPISVALKESASPLPEPAVQPKKVKVKTRPVPQEDLAAGTEEKEAAAEILQEPFRTPEFEELIEDLWTEKNLKKLVSLFNQLAIKHAIVSETYETNNKGYFVIRHPSTNQAHVRTYHHLHDSENHYASIFIALRDVLRDAGFR